MLKESVDNILEYQRLSKEEMERRGILGRLVGVCADFFSPTRNGRKYPESLWENVFNDPIMTERIENGVCYGELGHPLDREETDMEKIALCLAEVPKKGKDGKLRAVFDILNTPNGRILKSLCDYGSTIGISSRGSGDLETDFDGNESVNPDTYTCEGFDAVLIPAVKEARLQYVTESLNKKRYNKTLRDKLTESINKEDEHHQKIMRESLTTLGIKLDESRNSRQSLTESLPTYVAQLPQDVQDKIHQRALEIAQEQFPNDDQAQLELVDNVMSEKITNIRHLSEDDELSSFDDIIDELEFTNKDNQNTLEEHINIKLDEANFGGYNYRYEVHTYKIPVNDILRGGSKTIDGAIKIACDQIDDITQNPFEALDDKIHMIENMYIYDSELDTEIEEVELETYKDKIISNISNLSETTAKYESLQIGDYVTIKPDKRLGKVISRRGDVYKVDTIDGEDKNLPDRTDYYYESDLILNEDTNLNNNTDAKLNDTTQETGDIDFEALEDEVVNDESLVEELQKALRLNKKLDEKITSLQEKLSAGYTREKHLNEQLENYKSRVVRLSKTSAEVKALSEKLTTLQTKDEAATVRYKKLQESAITKKSKITKLEESIKSKDAEISSLKQQVLEAKKLKKATSDELDVLTNKYETLVKDSAQIKESLNKKLSEQQQAVERFKNIAAKSVDKYITSQAVRLGVKPAEIKTRLPESYSFSDIDSICEDLQEYKLNISNLPFSSHSRLDENFKVTVKNASSKTLVPREDDIDELSLRMAGLL